MRAIDLTVSTCCAGHGGTMLVSSHCLVSDETSGSTLCRLLDQTVATPHRLIRDHQSFHQGLSMKSLCATTPCILRGHPTVLAKVDHDLNRFFAILFASRIPGTARCCYRLGARAQPKGRDRPNANPRPYASDRPDTSLQPNARAHHQGP